MLFPDSIPFKAVWAWTSFWWRLAFAARLGVAMVLWCFGLVYLLWCEGIKWYVNCVIIFYCNHSTILQGQYWWEYMFCQFLPNCLLSDLLISFLISQNEPFISWSQAPLWRRLRRTLPSTGSPWGFASRPFGALWVATAECHGYRGYP